MSSAVQRLDDVPLESTAVAWHGSYSDRIRETETYIPARSWKSNTCYSPVRLGIRINGRWYFIGSFLKLSQSPFEGITISGRGTNGGARCFLGRAINPSGELAKCFGLDRYTPRYPGRRISSERSFQERGALILIKKKFESRKRKNGETRISSTSTMFAIYFGEKESLAFFSLSRYKYIFSRIYSSRYLRYCEFDACNIIGREK